MKDSVLREKANKEGLFDCLCPTFIETANKVIYGIFP